MFAASICRQLNITDMIVPNHSSAFSAYGLLEADYICRKSVTLGWSVENREQLADMAAARDKLVGYVRDEIERAGFNRDDIQINHGADFRYAGQLNELYMDINAEDLSKEGDGGLRDMFDTAYEEAFGPETAWGDSGLMLINYVITGIAVREKPDLKPVDFDRHEASEARTGTRSVYLPDIREQTDTPIYDSEKMAPGAWFEGPGIIEVSDTTIYIPRDATVERDGYLNFIVKL